MTGVVYLKRVQNVNFSYEKSAYKPPRGFLLKLFLLKGGGTIFGRFGAFFVLKIGHFGNRSMMRTKNENLYLFNNVLIKTKSKVFCIKHFLSKSLV